VNVLMAVDEVRRPTESVAEGFQLAPDFGLEPVVLEAAQHGVTECCLERQELALLQRSEAASRRWSVSVTW
jgi:hypothetical protein